MGSCILVSRLKFCLGKRMKFILASLLFVGCLHCEPLSVDVDIEEDGTRYKQKVEYDPVTKAVTYRVPSHNDVISSVNIIHAESNTMLTMFEDRNGKQCLIRSAPAGFEPEANALGAFAVSANKETLTPGRATIIRNIDYRKGKISQRQRMALLESMQILCEGIDIVQIEQIQVSEEEFRARTVSPFLNNTRGMLITVPKEPPLSPSVTHHQSMFTSCLNN